MKHDFDRRVAWAIIGGCLCAAVFCFAVGEYRKQTNESTFQSPYCECDTCTCGDICECGMPVTTVRFYPGTVGRAAPEHSRMPACCCPDDAKGANK